MSKAKSVIVTVADSELENIQKLATKLAAKGMKVDRVLPVTGIITGSCAAAKKAVLKAVKGVKSVEEDLQVQLPPPESEVQ